MKNFLPGDLITVRFVKEQDGKKIFERVVWLVSQQDDIGTIVYSERSGFKVGALMFIGEENGLASRCELFNGSITLTSKSENSQDNSPLNYYTFKTTPLETETFAPFLPR